MKSFFHGLKPKAKNPTRQQMVEYYYSNMQDYCTEVDHLHRTKRKKSRSFLFGDNTATIADNDKILRERLNMLTLETRDKSNNGIGKYTYANKIFQQTKSTDSGDVAGIGREDLIFEI